MSCFRIVRLFRRVWFVLSVMLLASGLFVSPVSSAEDYIKKDVWVPTNSSPVCAADATRLTYWWYACQANFGPSPTNRCASGYFHSNSFSSFSEPGCGNGCRYNYAHCSNGQCPINEASNPEGYCGSTPPPPNKNVGEPECPLGNPCNPANGNKFQAESDHTDGGPAAIRYYNSQFDRDLGFGFGWTSSFTSKRLVVSGTSVQILRSDARGEMFTCPSGGGPCTGDADTQLTLSLDASGYTLRVNRTGAADRYNLTGRLVNETDAAGRVTSYSYDSMGRVSTLTGPFGHQLQLSYDAYSRVSTITDAAGRVTGYIYDANVNLARVNYADGTAELYHYENASFPHHLTGISFVEANGTTYRYSTYAYDASGRAISTEHAAGVERFTLQYDSATQTTVRDAANTVKVMTFQTNLGLKRLVSNVNQGDGKSLTQSFDANNNLTCKKDEEGRVVTYTYNANNQKTSMTEGLTGTCTAPQTTSVTRTVTYQYLSPTLDLPTLIQGPSVYTGSFKRTEIAYTGNLPSTITQRGYTPTGTSVSRTVTLGYNSSGQVTSINGPRTDVSDVTTLAYNTCTSGGGCGQLASITNALGQVTTFNSYDANGRLTQMTDPNGLRTNYQYDARGRVRFVTQTPPTGSVRVTEYRYDAAGNVTFVSFPDTSTFAYLYNTANQLIRVTDNAGNYVAYGYDIKGNRLQEYTYDPGNTLVRQLDLGVDLRNHVSAINAAGSLTSQVHDAVGNLTSQTDPKNNPSTTHSYDALNRLMQTVNSLGGITGYGYDTNDRLTQVQAPNNATTQYQHDDLGNLLTEVSGDRGTTLYTHDEAGNVRTITDARGITASYSYDALNRVTRIDYPGTSEDVVLAYDTGSGCSHGAGRLCSVQDESGTTAFGYDPYGNLTTHTKTELGVAYTTTYTVDAGNRVTGVTYPGGRTVSYTRNATGSITGITATVNGAAQPLLQNVYYRADRLVLSQRFGNGIEESRSYDPQGRLTSQTLQGNAQPQTPVSSVALAPNLPSPQTAGAAVTFSAQASGGSGNYEYRFLLQGPSTNNVPAIQRNYSTVSNWTWSTAAANVGVNTVIVQARNVGSTSEAEATVSVEYLVLSTNPVAPSSVTLTSSVASPQYAGTTVRFTAQGQGGSGPYEYQFWRRANDNTWSMVRDFSTANFYDWKTSETTLYLNAIQVRVRNVGSTAAYQAYKQMEYYIYSSVTGVKLTPSVPSPRYAGTSVTFTAKVEGAALSGPYEYQFWRRAPNNVWSMVQDFSATTTLNWTFTATMVGNNAIQARVRTVGSTVAYLAYKQIDYYIYASGAGLDPILHLANAGPDGDGAVGERPRAALTELVATNSDDDHDATTVLVTESESSSRFWIKGPHTHGQWLAVTDYRPYVTQEPDTFLFAEEETVHVWHKQTDGTYVHAAHLRTKDDVDTVPVALPSTSETYSYTYDANGNVASRTTPSGTSSQGYDALDRLTRDTQPNLPALTFDYDGNGNRVRQQFDAYSETYTYTANTNRLESGRIHDAAGNLLNDGQGRTYTYNNAGRLTEARQNGTLVATYTYNAHGQRTRKTVGSTTTVYHYGLNGELLQETDASGNTQKAYVYVEHTPLAQIDRNASTETVAYLHTDHQGTPRLATNSAQTVVWRWDTTTAFGSMSPTEDPDGNGQNTVINLRFPGQYRDSESGLYYNWNRYYSPALGRYITSDPIGLAGGLNTFTYARNNPLAFIDPTGLYECRYNIGTHTMDCVPVQKIFPAFQSPNFVAGNNNLPGPLRCECQNNSSATDVPFHGPLPIGTYKIGLQRDESSRRDLFPAPETLMGGRDAMQTHGCGDPKTCSDGCIAATTNETRDLFNKLMSLEKRNVLHVRP